MPHTTRFALNSPRSSALARSRGRSAALGGAHSRGHGAVQHGAIAAARGCAPRVLAACAGLGDAQAVGEGGIPAVLGLGSGMELQGDAHVDGQALLRSQQAAQLGGAAGGGTGWERGARVGQLRGDCLSSHGSAGWVGPPQPCRIRQGVAGSAPHRAPNHPPTH